jgi:hypothetical protein
VRVEAADQEKLAYTFLTVGYSHRFSDKTFVWQEDLAPEKERRTQVAFEGGRWIFRNGVTDTSTLVGLRDRALIGVMTYAFGRKAAGTSRSAADQI